MSKHRFSVTGRIVVPREPVLQQIPIHTDLWREVRSAFLRGATMSEDTNDKIIFSKGCDRMKRKVAEFERMWAKKWRENPKDYPLMMTEEEWVEQFVVWANWTDF